MIQIVQRPGRMSASAVRFHWPEAKPADQGLDAGSLSSALDLATTHKADSLLVIRNGHLAFEQYWNGKTVADLQQTYSGTKALFSLLVARAIARGYLKGIDQPVRDLVPEMPQVQAQLTFRNVLAMQSGMENSVEIDALGQTGQSQLEIALDRAIVATPFTRYHYNNAAYRLLFTALERAANMDLEALTETEIFSPLSFANAHWVRLYAVSESGERFTGYQSIRMTPRDFAKSAQIVLDGGAWCGEPFVPAEFVASLVTAPNAAVNPSFGLFHHLNAGTFYRDIAMPEPQVQGRFIPGAPSDLFFMYGNGGQIVAGVPSLRLVIVRTGQDPGSSIYAADNHFAKLLKLITDAAS